MNKEEFSLEKAKQELRAGHNDAALSILEILDDRAFDMEVLFLLIDTYMLTQKSSKALKRIKEQENVFLTDKKGINLYLSVLILEQNFIGARTLLSLIVDNDLYKSELTNIIKAERVFLDDYPQTVREYERKFYHLGELTLEEQNKAMEFADYLPASSYIKSAKFLFLDPYLNQMVRTSVLQRIVDAQLKIRTEFLWADETIVTIDTSKIKSLESSRYFKKCAQKIKKITNEVGPIEVRMEQLRIYLSCVFPFPEKFISNPDDFVNQLIDHTEFGVENKLVGLDQILTQLRMGS